MTAVEEVNKKLLEMQGPGFSKDSGAEFLAIWCLQAGTDFKLIQPAAYQDSGIPLWKKLQSERC